MNDSGSVKVYCQKNLAVPEDRIGPVYALMSFSALF